MRMGGMQSPIHVFTRSQCVRKILSLWRFQDILAYGTMNRLTDDLAGPVAAFYVPAARLVFLLAKQRNR